MQTILITIVFIIILITFIYDKIYCDIDDKDPKPERKMREYFNTAHGGFLRGIFTGFLLGVSPYEAAIKNAAVFSVLNPTIMYLGY